MVAKRVVQIISVSMVSINDGSSSHFRTLIPGCRFDTPAFPGEVDEMIREADVDGTGLRTRHQCLHNLKPFLQCLLFRLFEEDKYIYIYIHIYLYYTYI